MPETGASKGPQYCPECGVEIDRIENFCGQCGTSLAAPGSTTDVPDHFGHITGDVYWDQRARYLILEVSGFLLMVLPPALAGDIFRLPVLLIMEFNSDLGFWIAANYQTVGVALLVFGLTARIRLDPEKD